jgi:ubiquinone/menaquinone biosynthesis C-methylase UbiE
MHSKELWRKFWEFKMQSVKVFDRYAKEYDEWFEHNRFAYLSELKAIRRLMPNGGYGLEVGVGGGRFAAPLGVEVGIDPSPNMLKFAKERGIKTIQAVGERLPFRDKEFDYILNIVTLCFVNNPELVIEESRRVLKDKGRIIIGIIDRESFLGRIYQKKDSPFYKVAKFFSAVEVIEILKTYGFREITTLQTIFELPDKIKDVEDYKEGYGEGGFVVIKGEK